MEQVCESAVVIAQRHAERAPFCGRRIFHGKVHEVIFVPDVRRKRTRSVIPYELHVLKIPFPVRGGTFEIGDIADECRAICRIVIRICAEKFFRLVAHAIAVGVGEQWIRRDGPVDFLAVGQAIAVRIRVQRICAERNFRAIAQPIAVRVGLARVCSALVFLQVTQAITVRVCRRLRH